MISVWYLVTAPRKVAKTIALCNLYISPTQSPTQSLSLRTTKSKSTISAAQGILSQATVSRGQLYLTAYIIQYVRQDID